MPGIMQLSFRAAACALLACAPLAAEQSVYLSVEGENKPLIKALAPVGTVALSELDIEKRNAETAGQLLEAAPSVSLKKGGAPGLAEVAGIRGFSGKNTAVLFNGKRLAADITGVSDLSVINPSALRGVEVFGGPVSPLYGANAQGGVINMLTADPSGPDDARGEASLEDYKTGAYSASARGGTGPVRLAVNAGRRYSGGFQQNGDYSGDDVTASLRAAPGALGVLRLEAMRSFLANGIPGGTPVPIGEWDGNKERQANSLTDRQETLRTLLSAGYSVPQDSPFALGVEGWTSTNDLTAWQYGGKTGIKTTLKAARATAGLGRRAALSVQYESNRLESETYGNHSIDTRSAGLETRIDLAGGLEAVLGARFENSSEWADQLNPRAVLAWRPLPGWKFSASAGRAWQAPTFADMYNPWAPSNPDLKPEHSWQYEVGAETERPGGFTASATVFCADIADKIALDAARGYAAYNLDKGRNAGVQPELKWRNDFSRHRVAYSFIYSEGRPQGKDWQVSAYNPLHRLSYTGDFDLAASLSLNVFIRHLGEQYTGIGRTGMKLPAFTTADATLRYKAGRYGLALSVNNLTDEHYAENADAYYGYYPMPGRTFRLKLSVALNG